jgi:hypothetical protein
MQLLVDALASLQHLRSLCLWPSLADDQLSIFWLALAATLPSFPRLEVLECNPTYAESAVARAGASCSCLKSMTLYVPSYGYPPAMDEAVAACVRLNPQLEEITIDCGRIQSLPPLMSPLLLDALRINYTIKNIELKYPRIGVPDIEATFNASTHVLGNLALMLRLNVCSRMYLATDPSNRCLGVSVLEQAKDDLNCIFFHLRENPLLCICGETFRSG